MQKENNNMPDDADRCNESLESSNGAWFIRSKQAKLSIVVAGALLILVGVADFGFGMPHEMVQVSINLIMIGFVLSTVIDSLRSGHRAIAAIGIVLVAVSVARYSCSSSCSAGFRMDGARSRPSLFRLASLPRTRSVQGKEPPAMRVRVDGFTLASIMTADQG